MVVIKDTEMPKHCMTCQYQDALYGRCRIGHFDTGAKCIKGDDKWYFKHPNCPLVEIITCKDCKYYREDDDTGYCTNYTCGDITFWCHDDYYCADAERYEDVIQKNTCESCVYFSTLEFEALDVKPHCNNLFSGVTVVCGDDSCDQYKGSEG